jgi:hypothetical protein
MEWSQREKQTGRYIEWNVWLSVGWMDWEAQATRGSQCIYLAVQMRAQFVQGEHRLPSGGPQLQALACTLGRRQQARAYFSIWYDGTLPFTDCGFVNLGWALAQGSQRATERWARQGSACTGESDAVRMGRY